ncbi:Cof-type HAD-IIB family hydrolase [Agrilactobacillus yilanensis]|uniref:Cof-type HAD-IIB family hydrolase n=1 Tax=Agrilactobacillus yilanensis TaxID=2485997 RepID=A0ABW4J608_9LACO|nr:Cof-type HAD-IIB family hydrolase [Agrilactobacillus yilanensis]
MTNYKGVVFFDLDDTLMNAHKTIDTDVVAALDQLKANGYLRVIASGRHKTEIADARKQSGINSFIALNGGYIEYDGKPIYKAQIDKSVVAGVVKIADELKESIGFFSDDHKAFTNDTEMMRKAFNYSKTPMTQCDPEFYEKYPVYMMLIFTDKNDKRYAYPYNEDLTFYRNTPYSIDTVLKNASKAQGIQKLLKAMNLEHLPTYAFGDGNNDLPMLGLVDHPIAMGNGIAPVKDRAEYVTETNERGGIIQGLKHYDLI